MTHDPLSPRASALAQKLGISEEAAALYLDSEVVDLHVDTFIWHRVLGYDLTKRHDAGLFGGLVYGQVDLPRLREAGVSGATWVITTNPLRDAWARQEVFLENLRTLVGIFETVPDHARVVRTKRDYLRARRSGQHGAFIGVQGGNALDYDLGIFERDEIKTLLRVTLVHLSSSGIGATSSPAALSSRPGLTARGKQYVECLDAARIFVDLAHVSKQTFWDAVDAHDPRLPLLVSHTGIAGVHEHWRNLDDDQLRAVADSGGVTGIMYHSEFLGDPLFAGRAATIVRHLEHALDICGEDHLALGSDWDGAICTPRDMRTCLELPRLVDIMLRRHWHERVVRKVLGENFLRVLGEVRP